MNWFRKLTGGAQPPPPPRLVLPLGLRLGGAVAIDSTPFRVHRAAFAFAAPEGDQLVEALGSVDLGDGSRLHRFYLSDDAWLQVGTTNGAVDDIKLFVFHETRNPPNQQAFRRWVEPGSVLGSRQIEIGGNSYYRVWGDPPETDWCPPIVYDETVAHPPGGERDFTLTHYSMLYQREIAGLDRYEYLYVSCEDSGPNEFCVVFSLGVDVSSADLSIT